MSAFGSVEGDGIGDGTGEVERIREEKFVSLFRAGEVLHPR